MRNTHSCAYCSRSCSQGSLLSTWFPPSPHAPTPTYMLRTSNQVVLMPVLVVLTSVLVVQALILMVLTHILRVLTPMVLTHDGSQSCAHSYLSCPRGSHSCSHGFHSCSHGSPHVPLIPTRFPLWFTWVLLQFPWTGKTFNSMASVWGRPAGLLLLPNCPAAYRFITNCHPIQGQLPVAPLPPPTRTGVDPQSYISPGLLNGLLPAQNSAFF